MFTGLIEEVGELIGVDEDAGVMAIRIGCDRVLDGLRIGDSVAVNGCCLTVVEIAPAAFEVQLVPETISRTSLGGAAVGMRVNLERSMAADGRFGGHIVQGHVDSAAVLAEIRDEAGGGRIHRYQFPVGLSRYVVEKGSVAVDGVSLTVASVGDDWFEVALIPHTLEATILGSAGQGDVANIEVDLVAKYVESIMRNGGQMASNESDEK